MTTPLQRFTTWGRWTEKPRTAIDEDEFRMDTHQCKHFAESVPDCVTKLEGVEFTAHTGRLYVCVGHFSCGYHMKPVDHEGEGRWHCISERAIGRTYHQVW